tara:strand:+ start:2462 stop:3412 length:951 start_codon:yes stop_codon:yes gene_type:complete
MSLQNIYSPIEKDLLDVESIIKKVITQVEDPTLSKIYSSLLDSKGKRIRPALVILSAKAMNNNSKTNVTKVAVAIELIHMASLLHDDVMDNSSKRHNQSTMNIKFGNEIPIGLGDYLYSSALELIAQHDNAVMKCVVSTVKDMSEGQLLQVLQRDNLDLSKEEYFLIVKKKTGSLFSASCEVGSLIVHKQSKALSEFGLNFGIAFQLVDDYLDIVGEEKKLGKYVQQDLLVGEVTLPIIHLFEMLSDKEKKELKTLLSSKDKKAIASIRSKLSTDKKTKEVISFYLDKARENIDSLSDSEYKESFIQLIDYLGGRV